MSKLSKALAAIKAAAPYVKGALVIAGEANASVTHKHKDKVDKALQGAYKAADALERIL